MSLTNCKPTPLLLADRSVIACTGSDAKEFLQGQITNDINLLDKHACIHTLILTPQGKILADMFIYAYDKGFYIDIHESVAQWLIKRFEMYKLRSDVVLEDLSEQLKIAFSTKPADNTILAAADPRPVFGDKLANYRNIIQANTQLDDRSSVYTVGNANYGLATFGVDYQASEFFPQDLWFDKLGSISYSKGCYVGQEVVSRMRHKSTARKRLLPFEGSHSLGNGDQILVNQKVVGTVISQHYLADHYITLAIMRMDKFDDDESVFVDNEGNALNLKKPDWMQNL